MKHKVLKWNYIDSIKSEITQTGDTEIEMLIGASCINTLEPLKVIPSRNGDPYAHQTKLGWCIVRPIQNAGHQKLLKCNRAAVKEASTDKLARQNFFTENAGKDMSIEQMFEQMYYNNLNEKGTEIGKIDGNI